MNHEHIETALYVLAIGSMCICTLALCLMPDLEAM